MKKLIQLFNQKKYDEIINITKKNYDENNFENQTIINFYGLALQAKGQTKLSILVFKKLLKKNSTSHIFLNNLGTSYYNEGDFQSAELYFKKSIDISPKYFPPYLNLKKIYLEIQKPKKALNILLKALDVANDIEKIQFFFEIAKIYRAIGDFEEAKKIINKILILDSNNSRAHKFLSTITNYAFDNNNHLQQLEKILKLDKLSNQDYINIYFALGKAYEQKLEIDKSALFYKKANFITNKIVDYNNFDQIKLIDEIRSFFDQITSYELFKKKPNGIKIIFICGMPRSGSTLVEQIISSHKLVKATGENNYLSSIINKKYILKNSINNKKLSTDLSDLNNLIESEYFSKNLIRNSGYKIFTDKTFQNFYWIGFIKLFFPNSIIINTVRNFKDNAFSIYKNSFSHKIMDWGYNEQNIVNYFRNYQNLMNYWNYKFPNFIHQINYEKIVSNPLFEINYLLKVCGLEFDENCLEFYKNNNSVFTTSNVQVRSKITTKAVNSHKKFYIYLSNFFDDLDKLN